MNIDFSIILPCYNEGNKIAKNIDILIAILNNTYKDKYTYEIILVNDGSSDNTLDEINKKEIEYSTVKVIDCGSNKGKGFAVKYGVSKSNGNIIGFIDSDLDISPNFLVKYINYLLDNTNCDMVIGNKNLSESKVKRSVKRKVLSIISKNINSILFSLPFSDTQVGLKVFRKSVANVLLKYVYTYGYAFDVEFLFFTKNRGFKIKDLPVTLSVQDKESSIRLRDMLEMLYDLFILFRRVIFISRFRKKRLKIQTKFKLFFLKHGISPFEFILRKFLQNSSDKRKK